jgi:hypothetical protein
VLSTSCFQTQKTKIINCNYISNCNNGCNRVEQNHLGVNPCVYIKIIFGTLFYDAFSVTRLYSVYDRITSKWWLWIDEGKHPCLKRNSNPQSQRPSDQGLRVTPLPMGPAAKLLQYNQVKFAFLKRSSPVYVSRWHFMWKQIQCWIPTTLYLSQCTVRNCHCISLNNRHSNLRFKVANWRLSPTTATSWGEKWPALIRHHLCGWP